MSLDELTAGVRYHYENSMNDIDGFIGAHDDRLPRRLSRKRGQPPMKRGFPFPKSPTGTGRILTPMYLTGA